MHSSYRRSSAIFLSPRSTGRLHEMYAIAGITGRVGGAAARRLLAEDRAVRAVLRDAAKGEGWVRQGAELAIADNKDAEALASAFSGAEGVFVMVPPYLAPDP